MRLDDALWAIPHYIQSPYRDVPISPPLWKGISPTRRALTRGLLDHQAIGFRHEDGRGKKSASA